MSGHPARRGAGGDYAGQGQGPSGEGQADQGQRWRAGTTGDSMGSDRVAGALDVLGPLARLPVEPDDVPGVLEALAGQAAQMATLQSIRFPFASAVVVTPGSAWDWLRDQAAVLSEQGYSGEVPSGG